MNTTDQVFFILEVSVPAAIILHNLWPWGWTGRRKEIKVKRKNDDLL